uniref:Aminotransferase-like plant mobile domain-containing protein n=1 Tax=Fagus sylvatica TaxID=28930 RepID=A0A2N9GZG4_FAGSY
MVLGDRGGDGGGPSSALGTLEPLEEVLGQPVLDPWSGWLSEKMPQAVAAWVPSFQEIQNLQIQRNEILVIPLILDFQCSKAIDWETWIDHELADEDFYRHLEQVGVLHSILISRSSNMYWDTEDLRQLVQRWCPFTHTFFFAHGELTVTLEDVENYWMLQILGDQDPTEVALSLEELKVEATLADYIGRKNISLGTQVMRFTPWMDHFMKEGDA